MSKKITLTIPDNLHKYIQEKGLSPSRFLQQKLKEEIWKEGKGIRYHLKDNEEITQ